MNPDSELFKKLVKDAGIQLVHWDDSPRLYIENMTYDGNLAKFAELIVKECMKLNSKELSITAIERLLPLYREHFGVEQNDA